MVIDFFLQIVIMLLGARLLGEIAAKFSVPSVIGELLAGILLGPSFFNILAPTDTINLLAQIGIVLLLFEVGIESDITKLGRVGLKASLSAGAGVILPFVLGFFITFFFFKFDTLLSLFVGSTLTATSIGVTLRVLSDLKKQQSHEAHIVLGAAIIDDIIGIVLLAILFEFASSNAINFLNTGKILLLILIFLVLAPILIKMISNIIKRYEKKSTIPGLLPTTIVSLLLLFAWLAHKFGAPELIGGFAAGLALSKSFLPSLSDVSFSERVEKQIKPIIHLFVPIFFVNIGLSLNFKEIAWGSSFVWLFSGTILLIAILGKLACGFVLFKEKNWIKWVIGIAMIPRGEVGLIFAEVGRVNKIFNTEVYAALILVIAITTLLTPLFLRFVYKRT